MYNIYIFTCCYIRQDLHEISWHTSDFYLHGLINSHISLNSKKVAIVFPPYRPSLKTSTSIQYTLKKSSKKSIPWV